MAPPRSPFPSHRHVYLTGFMGCGKTTHGRKLAPLLGLPFVDLDTYIEQKEAMGISQIFTERGEREFRDVESRTLGELIEGPRSVIALGGGTVCFGDNLARVKSSGLLVYLEMPAAALVARLASGAAHRPLIAGKDPLEMASYVASTLEKRAPYYRQAHLVVNGISLSVQQLYHEVAHAIEKDIR